jgi:hypothetical protein
MLERILSSEDGLATLVSNSAIRCKCECDRHDMRGSPSRHPPDGPTVVATPSTHSTPPSMLSSHRTTRRTP